MNTDFKHCPLGLIDNCIPEKSFFTDKISCVNSHYCEMRISPWSLPFTYQEIDGIMALIVIESWIHADYGSSLHYKNIINSVITDYGWGVAISILSKNSSDWNDLPW